MQTSHATILSLATVIGVFAVSLTVALVWGVRWAYVAVYLPVLMLLSPLPEVNIQHFPVLAPYAPVYAMLIALPFRGESLRFRFCSIDLIVVLLMMSAAVTGWTTEFFESGINILRNDTLRLALPYFLGRAVFQDWRMRRATLRVMIGLVLFISFFAAVEFRLYPYWYLHLLANAGMGNWVPPMAYSRYNSFRVSGVVEHPIFFGNLFVVVLGLLPALARSSGVPLRRPVVALSLVAALCCVIVSISFTPWLGTIAGGLALVAMTTVPWTRRTLLPLTLTAVLSLTGYTYYVAQQPVADQEDRIHDDGLANSMQVRQLIVRQTWAKSAEAGPFGFGLRPNFSDDLDFDLASVDNSYMQFAVTRGWVYVGLWIGIGVAFAYRAQSAFRHITDRSQVFPLAVCSATVLGLMVSMYTVWAGALYTVMWMILLALSNTLIDQVMDAAAAVRPGFPVVGPLRPPTVRLPATAGYGV